MAKTYIFGTDLSKILDTSSASGHGIIKRAIQKKELILLRKDLYLIKNTRELKVDAFEIASIIYGPLTLALNPHFFIANPLKALADIINTRKRFWETSESFQWQPYLKSSIMNFNRLDYN